MFIELPFEITKGTEAHQLGIPVILEFSKLGAYQKKSQCAEAHTFVIALRFLKDLGQINKCKYSRTESFRTG